MLPGADSGNIQIPRHRFVRRLGLLPARALSTAWEGDLNSVDASQIDQISVLKDAASAAIYEAVRPTRSSSSPPSVRTKANSPSPTAATWAGKARGLSGRGQRRGVHAPFRAGPPENDGAVSLYTDEYIASYRRNKPRPDAYPIIDWQDQLR